MLRGCSTRLLAKIGSPFLKIKTSCIRDALLCCSPFSVWLFTMPFYGPEATVYGKHDACIQGLAVMHRDKLNTFKASAGWKHGLIRDCAMLPRAQMFKPEERCLKTQIYLLRFFTFQVACACLHSADSHWSYRRRRRHLTWDVHLQMRRSCARLLAF